MTQKYRDKLIETFKSLLIQTRETHVKQLGNVGRPTSGMVRPILVDIHPNLAIEPFPTFYLRSARAYVFLRNVLIAALGESALQGSGRMIEDGTLSAVTLDGELTAKIDWLYGLHVVAAAAIGMADELTDEERVAFEPAAVEEVARAWLRDWRRDADVARDPRVAIPIVSDAVTQKTRNLAVVGVKVIRLSASFVDGYEPEVMPVTYDCVVSDFVSFKPYMLVEQTLEFERDLDQPPLTREALRERLDGQSALDGMRAALERP